MNNYDRSRPPTDAEQATKLSERAAQGWASRLAGIVSALIVILSLTGLWLYLAPFSVSSQVQLLLHVAAGLALVVPGLYYLLRHIRDWCAQRFTVVMVMGYVLGLMLLVCMASGIVVTWNSIFGRKLSPTWDFVHLLSGLILTALLLMHMPLAFVRRRQSFRREAVFRRGVWAYVRRVGGGLAAGAAGVVVVAASWPAKVTELDVPEGYRLSEYVDHFAEYRGNPFAPSYARTASAKLVSSELLSGSASCGTAGCHEQILAEWQPSAHRFSAMNPSFQRIQKDFAADRNAAETRYCAGCHDPISLFAGAKDIQNLSLSAPGMQEGCSCVVCHSIAEADQRGNADYVLVPPKKYIWEGTSGWKKFLSDALIRAYPRQHLADYDRNILRAPEFCGTCHKQFIPEALNRFGLVAGQNQYDEWRMGHWHVDDPDKNLSCVDCHMRLVYDSSDPGRGEAGAVRRSPDDGAHRHHGTIATNFLMPQVLQLPHWQEQVRLTQQWMRGETVIKEIAHLWPPGPVASLQLVAPQEAEPDADVRLLAIVANRKAGHNLTTGPLDFMRVWVHLRIVDTAGETVAEWGALDPVSRRITDSPGVVHQIGNSRQEGTLVLEGQPIDGAGQDILKHQLWQMAGGKGKRVVFPGYSDNQSYTFRVPTSTVGPLHVTADFNFQRYRQDFLDRAVPELAITNGVRQPTVVQSSAEAWITIVDANAEKKVTQTHAARVER